MMHEGKLKCFDMRAIVPWYRDKPCLDCPKQTRNISLNKHYAALMLSFKLVFSLLLKKKH